MKEGNQGPPADDRRKSKLLLRDAVEESWIQVSRGGVRSLLTAAGVALGVAALVATSLLVATVRFQVGDSFNALRATQVEARWSAEAVEGDQGERHFPPAGLHDRLGGKSGVIGVAALRKSVQEQTVAVNAVEEVTGGALRAPIHVLESDESEALGLEISGLALEEAPYGDRVRICLVSRAMVESLGREKAPVGERIYVAGIAFSVVGVIESSPRMPSLESGIVLPAGSSSPFDWDSGADRVVVVTEPGASGNVANILPAAVDPLHPGSWTAYAPTADSSIRMTVDRELLLLSYSLGGVVLVLGIFMVANVILTSVLQRFYEIGLRRSLGSRRRHICVHVMMDAALVGGLGSLVGVMLSLVSVLGLCVAQGWVPVVDWTIPFMAVLAGPFVGALAGIYPAAVASSIEPTEALRSG